MTTLKTPRTRAIIVNVVIIAGLFIERWQGAPWLAITITAGIALPLANTLMALKARRQVAQ